MKFFTRRELNKALVAIEKDQIPEAAQPARREMLERLGLIAATGAVFYACGKDDEDVVNADTTITDAAKIEADVKLLNAALGLEHEAVAVYTAAAGLPIWTGDLPAKYLTIAGSFLGHHAIHAATLTAKIKALGGTPAKTKTAGDYFKADKITDASTLTLVDVLKYALGKERVAAQSYALLAGTFYDPKLATIFANHAADEAAHYAVYRAAFTFLSAAATDDKVFTSKADLSLIVPGATPATWPK